MKKLNFILIALGTISILVSSCGSAHKGVFGKRKYTSGIFHSKKSEVNVDAKTVILAKQNFEKSKPTDVASENIAALENNALAQNKNTENSKTESKIPTINREKITQIATSNNNKETSKKAFAFSGLTKAFGKNHSDASKSFDIEETNKPQASETVEIILAIFLPAIGVWLHDGKRLTTNFWVSLILWCLLVTWLVASIFAVLVVLDVIDLG